MELPPPALCRPIFSRYILAHGRWVRVWAWAVEKGSFPKFKWNPSQSRRNSNNNKEDCDVFLALLARVPLPSNTTIRKGILLCPFYRWGV